MSAIRTKTEGRRHGNVDSRQKSMISGSELISNEGHGRIIKGEGCGLIGNAGHVGDAADRLNLVLEMLGVDEPEQVAIGPLNKLHRTVENNLKLLSSRNSKSHEKPENKYSSYLDKLLSVLDMLELKDPDEAIQMSSIHFSRYIEQVLEEKPVNKNSSLIIADLKAQLQDARSYLAFEKEKNSKLRAELSSLSLKLNDVNTLRTEPEKTAQKSSRTESISSASKTFKPKFFDSNPRGETISSFENMKTPFLSSKRQLESGDILQLLAERVRRLSETNSSAETVHKVPTAAPTRNLFTDAKLPPNEESESSPDLLRLNGSARFDSREEASIDDRIYQLQADLQQASARIETLNKEILEYRLQLSKKESLVLCAQSELEDTQIERDNACSQVDELINVVREVEKSIQELTEERDQEINDREEVELALEEQVEVNVALKRELENLKKEVEILEAEKMETLNAPDLSQPPILLHSPTFHFIEPKSDVLYPDSSNIEAQPRVCSQSNLQVESVRLDEWSSLEGRRRSSGNGLEDTVGQTLQRQVNESHAILKEELEKRDSRLEDLELKLARLAMSHHFQSLGINREDEDGNKIKKTMGGVLRNRRISLKDTEVDGCDAQSSKKSPMNISRFEKKSVRILEATEDGGLSIVDTGRDSPARYSSYSRIGDKNKHFLLRPELLNNPETSKDDFGPSEEIDESCRIPCKLIQSQSVHCRTNRSSRKSLEKININDSKVKTSRRSQSIDRSKDNKKTSKIREPSKSNYASFVEDIQAEEKSRKEFSVRSKYTVKNELSPRSRKSLLKDPKIVRGKDSQRKSIVVVQREKDESFDSQASIAKNHPKTERTETRRDRSYQNQIGLSVPGGVIRNPVASANKLSDLESAEELILSKLNSEREISKNPMAALFLAHEHKGRTIKSNKIMRQHTAGNKTSKKPGLRSDKWEPATGRVAEKKHGIEGRATQTPGYCSSKFIAKNVSPQSGNLNSAYSPI